MRNNESDEAERNVDTARERMEGKYFPSGG